MAHDLYTEAMRSAFGSRVSELRMKQNLSQAKFALMIGMDRSYLNGIERGRRNVSIDNIFRIFAGLDVSPAEFFAPITETQGTITYSTEELQQPSVSKK